MAIIGNIPKSGEPLVCFSALDYSIEDLDQGDKKNYRHTNDLVKRDYISLNMDYKQSGVGGDDSWSARPHPQYRLKYGEYEYSYKDKTVFGKFVFSILRSSISCYGKYLLRIC